MRRSSSLRLRNAFTLPAFLIAGSLAAAASSADAACTVGRLAELPVTMSGLRPIITAKVNGTDAPFIADSGAFYSLISPGNAKTLALPLGPAPFGFYLTGVGGNASAQVATVKNFTLGTVPLTNVEFLVGGSEFDSVGVIGQNIWGFADVEYDLPHGAIRLMRPHDCGNANFAYWASGRPYSTVAIEDRASSRAHTVGIVEINGVKVHAMFDTGAPVSMMSLATAAKMGIKPDSPGVVPGGAGGGIGRKRIPTWITPIASFKTDGEEIRNLHLRIGDLGDTEMLIGADFFIAHRVYVANGAKKLFFTYEGGPVFNTHTAYRDATGGDATPTTATGAEPTDADGFSRRGAVFATQHDYPRAIADFTRAIALAPAEPHYPYQRALAYLESGQPAAAAIDIDHVLALRPGDLDALLTRAEIRAAAGKTAAALDDLDAAARAAARTANERLSLAQLYEALGALEPAIAQLDLWIAGHPDDSSRPEALNGRCWSRALLGVDLKLALADCDAAIRAEPKHSAFLDSRGLVRLRLGDYDRAIADYDAALAAAPGRAWSLYGRGIAKLRKGLKPAGEADIAAAVAAAPGLPEDARHHGIAP